MSGTTQLKSNDVVVSTTAPLPVTIISGTGSDGYVGTSTVTRAANQTPYTAEDVVGGALTIATAGPAGENILVTGVRCTLNITALPAAMTTFALYFYSVTPPSAIADNSPFTYGSGDRASFLGKITGMTASLLGTTGSVYFEARNVNQQFKLAASSTTLYAYLVTQGAFTPAANSETYTLTVHAVGV